VTSTITPSAARLVTALRYRDLAAAIEWLCIAFGFEKHRVISGEDGAVAVAQLLVGGNMIMLLPVGGSELDRLMRQPDEIGGAETQSCYLAVDDIDAHYAIAKAAGAEFVLDLKAYDNGGRGFSCRDPEGHIWNFGTYDPWEGKSLVAPPPPPADKPAVPRGKRHAAGLMAAMAVVTVVVGMGGWTLATLQHGAPAAKEMRFSATKETPPSAVEEARFKAEIAAAQKRTQEALDRVARITAELAQERSARQSAEHAAQAAREAVQRRQGAADAADAADGATHKWEAQALEERRAKESAERAVKASADRIAKERSAKRTAQRATLVVQKQLALARAAKRLAEQSAKEAAEELARERAAREAAERAAKEALAKLKRAQGAEKRGALAPNPDRSSRRLSKEAGTPGG
jgi:uncharacterized glyoxalase superfamily protein PhnB